MNLEQLIDVLREESNKTNATPNYLRIAADMIEHLKEERTELIAANQNANNALFALGDKLCALKAQIKDREDPVGCMSCSTVYCNVDKQAFYKLTGKKCPDYKSNEKAGE